VSATANSTLEPLLDAERAFRADLCAAQLSPLWDVMGLLVTPAPTSPALPHHWAYELLRPIIFRSAEIISAEQAERRVLVLENIGLPGRSSITHSLYAGIQLVMPGESARCHRHSQSALRFVMEGEGAFTNVNGERLPMYPGDLILTPSWAWHDHGNESRVPIVWLDGLDVPLVGLLDASFSEGGAQVQQPIMRPLGDNEVRYGTNMLPLDDAPTQGIASVASPLLRYPYEKTRETLLQLAKSELSKWHGVRMRFAHPTTGDWPMPTMGPFAQMIPAGFVTRNYQSTDGSVFLVAEGTGIVNVGDRAFQLVRGDVFVVPSWMPRRFAATVDLILLAFSDRPAQERLGLWRESLIERSGMPQ
jgi:gentisate 1,2-dioxygenase